MASFDAGSIEAKLTLDRTQFKRELAAARAEAKRLEDNGIEVKANVDLDAGSAEARIKELEAELRGLEAPKLNVDVDDTAAKAKIDLLKAELARLRNPHVNVDVDEAAAVGKLALLRSYLAAIPDRKTIKLNVETGNGVGRTQAIVTAVLAALPLIPPLLAVAGAGIVALSASLVAAGAGVGVLALGIVGVIKQYKDLVKHHKELTATAKGYEVALNGLRAAWNGWIAAIAPAALSLITQFFKFIAVLLPRLVPIFNAFAKVASGALTALSNWMMGPEGTAVLKWIETFGAEQFGTILTILGNVGRTLLNILQAFTPLASNMMSWLQDLTAGWVTWSSTLASNPQFQQFIAYVRENGPLVGAALVSLGKALVAILIALAPLGPPMLEFITNVGNFISAMDPNTLRDIIVVVGVLAAAWTAFEIVMSAVGAAVLIYNAGAAVVTGLTWAWVAAQWALDAAMSPAALVILAIVAAVALLAFGIYELVTHFDAVKSALASLWHNMGEWGKNIDGWGHTVAGAVSNAFKAMYGAVVGFGGQIRNAGVSAFSSMRSGIGSALSATGSAVSTWFHSIQNTASSVANATRNYVMGVWNGLSASTQSIFRGMWAVVTGIFNAGRAAVVGVANVIKALLNGDFVGAKNAAIAAFNGMRAGIVGAMNGALGAIRGIAGSIRGVFSGAGGWLLSAGQRIMGGLISGIQTGINQVQGLLSSVTNLIPSWKGPAERDARLLRPAGNLIMSGLISGIRDQVNPLKNTLTGVTDLIGGTSARAGVSVATQGTMGGGGGGGRVPDVQIHVYNPIAEPSSVSAVNGIKDLAVMGVFN